jgi:hypothetical protein
MSQPQTPSYDPWWKDPKFWIFPKCNPSFPKIAEIVAEAERRGAERIRSMVDSAIGEFGDNPEFPAILDSALNGKPDIEY